MSWPFFGEINFISVFVNLLDILIVAYLFYKLLMIIRGTRAVQLIRGIVVLFIFLNVSDFVGFHLFGWILQQTWAIIFLALAVIFQPELRRTLEQIGRGQIIPGSGSNYASGDIIAMIDEVIASVTASAKTKTGVLIVIERDTGLNDYIETGIQVDALVTEELLNNIFTRNTPLHDGAAIIRGNRLIAAACFLPLTDNPYISSTLGTRHRAAIGIGEVSDCISVVVSEENGIISLAREGKLVRNLDEKQLRELLSSLLIDSTGSSVGKLFRIKRKEGAGE